MYACLKLSIFPTENIFFRDFLLLFPQQIPGSEWYKMVEVNWLNGAYNHGRYEKMVKSLG